MIGTRSQNSMIYHTKLHFLFSSRPEIELKLTPIKHPYIQSCILHLFFVNGISANSCVYTLPLLHIKGQRTTQIFRNPIKPNETKKSKKQWLITNPISSIQHKSTRSLIDMFMVTIMTQASKQHPVWDVQDAFTAT